MAESTHIEWTDATWNPVTGCAIVSPGCTNCYAMRLAGTRLAHLPSRAGLTRDSKAGPVWTGEVRFNAEWLDQPLRWRRPRRIFVCAHGDLFAEGVKDEWIDQVFAVMALAPHHTFQVLTKRPERMRAYINGHPSKIAYLGRMPLERVHLAAAGHMDGDGGPMDALKAHGNLYSLYLDAPWPLPNVWLGVSAEDQRRADERVPELLATPAAVRFVSAEPLLGPIDFNSAKGGTLWIGGQRGCHGDHQHGGRAGEVIHGVLHHCYPRRRHHHHDERYGRGLDWIIVGGESGHGARPMHPDWARQIRDACQAAGTAFFFKQWGQWQPREWCRDGGTHALNIHPEATFQKIQSHPNSIERVGAGPDWIAMANVGKKAAGRLLDSIEHSGMPELHHG